MFKSIMTVQTFTLIDISLVMIHLYAGIVKNEQVFTAPFEASRSWCGQKKYLECFILDECPKIEIILMKKACIITPENVLIKFQEQFILATIPLLLRESFSQSKIALKLKAA